MKAIAVIVGVMMFLWATAVIAAGLSFFTTDGRLGRREWYQVAFAMAIFVACIIGFMMLDLDATLPPPKSKTFPPVP
jgi:hypothetical protein